MSFFTSITWLGWIEILSNFGVLLALCGESHWGLRFLVPPTSKGKTSVKWRREKLRKKFEYLLIIGIAGEVGCLPFALIHTASLNREAGQAWQRANEANERTALVESNNLVLQKQLEPRIIRSNQITNFIFLTSYLPKIPIRIAVSSRAGPEVMSYAWQIRRMFEQAGFPTPNSDTNAFLRIHSIEGAISVPMTYELVTNKSYDLFLSYNSTNNPHTYISFGAKTNNGLIQQRVLEGDTNSIYGALVNCLRQDKIDAAIYRVPEWEKTNEYEFFVVQKFFYPKEQ